MASSLPIHGAAALWIGSMLLLSAQNPPLYDALLQEDRFIEWLTAALFCAAGALRVVTGIRHKRWFDLLVGVFCIFVGGEEFSWGQRLFGFTPPAVFLEHNTQQEFTLHNFADIFGKPKGILILALLGYGLLTPLLARYRRIGASRVKVHAAIWLVIAALLLLWYPVDLTGEWVEALAGFLFLATSPVPLRQRNVAAVVAIVAAAVLTFVSAQRADTSGIGVQCAHLEARALLADIVAGLGDYADMLDRNVHKRIYTAVDDGYVGPEWTAYAAVRCAGESNKSAEKRRRYVVDPWGMAYWVRSRRAGDRVRITVYSFGPNRSRDARDIRAETVY